MKKSIGFLAITLLMACNNSNQSSETKDEVAVADTVSIVVPLSFEDGKVGTIYNAYILLKNKLVATNFEEAKGAAKQLAEDLKGYKGCENAEKISKEIAEAKDIVVQRSAFTDLNAELISLFKQSNIMAGTIYLQHCPMANNGDGGDWLSSEKKIQNPYYGDEMMECGRVVEEIKSK